VTTPTFPLTYPCPGCKADVPSEATHCPACGMHLRNDRVLATPAERMQAACELREEGVEHYRQRMTRENPEASETEVDAMVWAWLLKDDDPPPGFRVRLIKEAGQ
jgi:Rv0078B-related antitoxin